MGSIPCQKRMLKKGKIRFDKKGHHALPQFFPFFILFPFLFFPLGLCFYFVPGMFRFPFGLFCPILWFSFICPFCRLVRRSHHPLALVVSCYPSFPCPELLALPTHVVSPFWLLSLLRPAYHVADGAFVTPLCSYFTPR